MTPRNTIVTIFDPEKRLELWKDAANRLLAAQCNDILEYLENVRSKLQLEKLQVKVKDILEALEIFRAYQDPLRKKSYLLLKFLLRTGLLEVVDPTTLKLPIDNHLIRLALRIGLVEIIDDELKKKILLHNSISEKEDRILREKILEAYMYVLEVSGLPPIIVDDLFWHVVRFCCQKESPNCESRRKDVIEELKQRISIKIENFCPFIDSCLSASEENRRRLVEPFFRSIYY